MGSLALKFEQLIYPSLGMKISTAKAVDTIECSHPFSMTLRWGAGGEACDFFFFFFLFPFGCRTTGLSFEESGEPGKDPGNHL